MFDAPGEPGPRERAIKHIHESQPSAFRRAARVLRNAWAPPASREVRGKLAAYERFVLFVGYPGSGHTLAGSILNAHPQALVANELDALFYLHNGLRRDRIVNAIARHERKFDRHARQNPKGYSYKFPGDSLDHKATIHVLGDKKGYPTARRLAKHPWLADTIRRELGPELRVVHVVRNPFDLAASFAKRSDTLISAAWKLQEMAKFVQLNRNLFADDIWHTVHFEDLIAQPRHELTRLLEFVGLDAREAVFDGVLPQLFDAPPHPAADRTWTGDVAAAVAETGRFDAGFRRYPGVVGAGA